MTEDRYASLKAIFERAVNQAEYGKGKERHVQDNESFDEQPIMAIQKMVGYGFSLGQAIKKLQESARLPYERAIPECLGAMNYIAAAIIYREKEWLKTYGVAIVKKEGAPVHREKPTVIPPQDAPNSSSQYTASESDITILSDIEWSLKRIKDRINTSKDHIEWGDVSKLHMYAIIEHDVNILRNLSDTASILQCEEICIKLMYYMYKIHILENEPV